MTTPVLLACLLLVAAVMIYVFAPVSRGEAGSNKSRLQYLYERRDVIYDNLRDLNFEHRAGKYTEADFTTMRASMEEEAAKVLAEIAQLTGAPSR
jgi:hypothetical protein